MGSHRWKNRLLNTLTMLMLAPTLGACASMKTFEWTEDVQLSNGKVFQVVRTSEYRAITDLGGGRGSTWLFVKSSIKAEFPAPVARHVIWEGLMSPIVLDVLEDNEAYLVGVPTAVGVDQWKVRPHEFYVVFRLTGEEWEQIPLKNLPQTAKPNLFVSDRDFFIKRGERSGAHINIDTKRKLDSDPSIERRFKTIVRLPDPPEKK